MTDKYIGKHGEFDRNDENLDILEDMYGTRAVSHDADFSSYYGREHNTDGFRDEEDW